MPMDSVGYERARWKHALPPRSGPFGPAACVGVRNSRAARSRTTAAQESSARRGPFSGPPALFHSPVFVAPLPLLRSSVQRPCEPTRRCEERGGRSGALQGRDEQGGDDFVRRCSVILTRSSHVYEIGFAALGRIWLLPFGSYPSPIPSSPVHLSTAISTDLTPPNEATRLVRLGCLGCLGCQVCRVCPGLPGSAGSTGSPGVSRQRCDHVDPNRRPGWQVWKICTAPRCRTAGVLRRRARPYPTALTL